MKSAVAVRLGSSRTRQLLVIFQCNVLSCHVERIIHSEVLSSLEAHHLISTYQYGFRRGHSTSHLLLETVNDWPKALECRDSCHCLLLDFAKAFDSVPHQRLLLRLQSLGVCGQLLRWICSFLTTRSLNG